MAALNELAILIRRFFRLDLGYIHCKWSLNHLSIGNGLPFTGPDASIVSLIHCNVKESVFLTNNGMLFFFFRGRYWEQTVCLPQMGNLLDVDLT